MKVNNVIIANTQHNSAFSHSKDLNELFDISICKKGMFTLAKDGTYLRTSERAGYLCRQRMGGCTMEKYGCSVIELQVQELDHVEVHTASRYY